MPSDSVVLYRITHERYADAPFSGEGGLHYKSRWASKGQRVSYAADHLATATLEKIAGVQRADLLTEMVYVKAEVAASHVTPLPEADWPDDWAALPPSSTTRAVGDAWLKRQQSALLRVPSVVLPHSQQCKVKRQADFQVRHSRSDIDARTRRSPRAWPLATPAKAVLD